MLRRHCKTNTFALSSICLITLGAPAWGAIQITAGPNFGSWTLGEDQIALTTTGGSGTQTWTVHSGSSLPPGFAVRTDIPPYFPSGTQAGLIGLATQTGTYNFTLDVTDASGSDSRAFTLKITALNLKDGYPLPDGFEGVAYSLQLTPLNAAGSVTFAGCGTPNSTGLPAGMSLSSGGLLSGTPSAGAAGNYNISFSMSDGTDTICRGL